MTSSSVSLFSDDPIDGSPERPDLMGRADYSTHLVTLLQKVRGQSESSVMAVIGPWGSGKTSILRLTANRLTDHEGQEWRVAWFNPWIYSDLESMQLGFFAELRNCLSGSEKWSNARAKIGEFGQAIAPVTKLTALFGLDASGPIEGMAKVIAGDSSASSTHLKAEKALREVSAPLLVIIDDLDRLAPDELLLVMKLVRLVGRLPNVYYLLAYDEKTLLDVLSRTPLVALNDTGRGREYLEKIVQVRLDLPQLGTSQIDSLVDSAFNAVLDGYRIILSSDEEYRMGRAYQDHLRHRLSTPRSINRYFAQVEALYATVEGEVNFVDFALITWLRTFEPQLYGSLPALKMDLTGRALGADFGKRRSASERLDDWRAFVERSQVNAEHIDGILGVLALLFIPVKGARANMTYGGYYYDALAQTMSVGHIDYFDRYFSFGVPADDIPDSAVASAINDIADGHPDSPAATVLADALLRMTSRAVRKIGSLRGLPDRRPIELLRFLNPLYGELPHRTGLFADDPQLEFEWLAGDLLMELDEDAGLGLLSDFISSGTGLAFVSRAIRRMSGPPEDPGEPDRRVLTWRDAGLGVLAQGLEEVFISLQNREVTKIADSEFQLFWEWRAAAQAKANEWMARQVFSGQWPLLDTLCLIVPIGTAYGTDGPPKPSLGELSMGLVDELFGLERVLDTLADQLDGAALVDRWHTEATPEATRAYVLSCLRQERDRRSENAALPEGPQSEEEEPSSPEPSQAEKETDIADGPREAVQGEGSNGHE